MSLPSADGARRLSAFLRAQAPVLVLTGAGVSVRSGIPCYRDRSGRWRHAPPMRLREFSGSDAAYRRYWARAAAGWPRFAAARPGIAHRALAALEAGGWLRGMITQNVDGLHQRAGSTRCIDLHGRLDRVVCLDCGHRGPRPRLDTPWSGAAASTRPDGDAAPVTPVPESFRPPRCGACGGRLKPDVVFFGEAVPRLRVRAALGLLAGARGLLVVGSSLTVYSGLRFCLAARELGTPMAIVNDGPTRADALAALRLAGAAEPVLAAAARELAPATPAAVDWPRQAI